MRRSGLLIRTTLLGGASIAMVIALLPPATAADSGIVAGTVTAKGARTSADIVVSLRAPGLTVTPPKQPIEMDQKAMLFVPAVLPVVRGTAVRFLNSDPTPHNVFSPEGKYNLGTWPQGEARDYTFDKPGSYTQLCRVHPEMEAYVVVLETPYFATTDKAGRYEIKNVPPGKYTLVTWGRRLKNAEQAVVVETGKTTTIDVTVSR